MFTRKEQLIQRTGEFGIGRYDFIKQLINEFTKTTVYENKRQTLANLVNFAYDPINYNFIKQLHVIDLFLAELSDDNEELTHFALAGLCNLACDPESREYIIALNGIKLTSDLLLHTNEEISLNALTTLFYLFDSENAIVPNGLKLTVIEYEINMIQIFRRLSNLIPKKIYVGQEVSIVRKISKEDVNNFALLSGDTNTIHSTNSSEMAVVHGALLNSFVSSVIGTQLPGFGTVVVQQTLHFPNKCYVDETVKVIVKLVEDRKIIKVEFSCNVIDKNKVVLFGTAKLVMNK